MCVLCTRPGVSYGGAIETVYERRQEEDQVKRVSTPRLCVEGAEQRKTHSYRLSVQKVKNMLCS